MNVTYNPLLVVLSALIAVVASYTALELASRVTASQGSNRQLWLTGGAIAMGTGIWSMHFIAMLAFSIPIFIGYDLMIVILSLIAAILAAWQALVVVCRPQPTARTIFFGSLSMGMGIAIMHYTGMAAMRMPADLSYRPHLFLLSVVIAVFVSLAALKLSIRFRNSLKGKDQLLKLVNAVIMGAAVLSMHYTGMAAAVFKPNPTKVVEAAHLDNLSLAYIVCLLTMLILSMTLSTMYMGSEREAI
ncbi:MAG: MHYT domain-containing protein [Coleofasciculaceae cyanobacterium]